MQFIQPPFRSPSFCLRDLFMYIHVCCFSYLIYNNQYMSQLPINLALHVKNASSSIAGRVLLGTSVFCGFMSIYSYMKSFEAQSEIQFRKKQLKLPIIKLTEQQLVNPPWNHQNLQSWLYRRVEVIGRPIHRLSCLIPRTQFGIEGYEYVVPLVAREDSNFDNRYGILFSKGFLPKQFKSPTNRPRIERVDRQKFVGFVSKLDELKGKSWFEGNAYQAGRLQFTNSDLVDIAKSSQLLNQKQASVAVVEQLEQIGIVDEKHSQRYACDCHFSTPYPYAKTEAGALQLDKMPWNYRNEAQFYIASSLAAFIVGASVF